MPLRHMESPPFLQGFFLAMTGIGLLLYIRLFVKDHPNHFILLVDSNPMKNML